MADIQLSDIAAGSGGFVINGQTDSDRSGFSVAGAGDVNGDGLADLIVGAPYGSAAAGNQSGRSYVVFGKNDGAVIDLTAIEAGLGGFIINGQGAYDQSGFSVAGAGDVNGDGFADLIVGARFSDPVELSAVAAGTGGFVINGQAEYDNSGRSVASAGDVNGDGLADLIVGADV